jgi:hypothetical protein
MFNFKEFSELAEDDILEWWTEKKLPHPGCPVSFKMVLDIIRYVYGGDLEAGRRCLGNVKYHYVNLDYIVFYFPYKDKSLMVPRDKSLDGDFDSLATLFGIPYLLLRN